MILFSVGVLVGRLQNVIARQIPVAVGELNCEGNVLRHELPRSKTARVDLRVDRAGEDGPVEPEAHGCCFSGEGRLHDSVDFLGSPIQEVSAS